jgi:hypothetical protein
MPANKKVSNVVVSEDKVAGKVVKEKAPRKTQAQVFDTLLKTLIDAGVPEDTIKEKIGKKLNKNSQYCTKVDRKPSTGPRALFDEEYKKTLADNLTKFEKELKKKKLVPDSQEWKDAIKEYDATARVKDPMKGLIYNVPAFNLAWNIVKKDPKGKFFYEPVVKTKKYEGIKEGEPIPDKEKHIMGSKKKPMKIGSKTHEKWCKEKGIAFTKESKEKDESSPDDATEEEEEYEEAEEAEEEAEAEEVETEEEAEEEEAEEEDEE